MAQYKVEVSGINTGSLPLLSNDEKETLIRRIKQGDKEARTRYIQGNLRLVLSIIKRFQNSNENMDDLFQIGCIGTHTRRTGQPRRSFAGGTGLCSRRHPKSGFPVRTRLLRWRRLVIHYGPDQ